MRTGTLTKIAILQALQSINDEVVTRENQIASEYLETALLWYDRGALRHASTHLIPAMINREELACG